MSQHMYLLVVEERAVRVHVGIVALLHDHRVGRDLRISNVFCNGQNKRGLQTLIDSQLLDVAQFAGCSIEVPVATRLSKLG